MRKIEKEMLEAIKNAKFYKKDNTQVSFYSDDPIITRVHLHGFLIAEITDKDLWLDDCGYQTKTTKSRLNAILSYYDLGKIYCKNYQWYLNDEVWTGSKVFSISNPPKPIKS